MRLLLFDIDGTLINSSRIGRAALGRALHDVFGTAGALESYVFAGKTDRKIVTDLLAAEGWAASDVAARLPELDERMAAAGRELFTSQSVWPCPGVLPLLAALAALARRDDVVLGLLTGNIEATAPLKLAAAGIDPAQFVAGAFGSDSHERDDLFHIAVERVGRATGLHFAAKNVMIIGDTPADIRCAKAGGGQAVAVATGPYPSVALQRHHPDYLFDNLAHTKDVLEVLIRPAAEFAG